MDSLIRIPISVPFNDVFEQLGQPMPGETGGILQLRGTDRLFIGGGCEVNPSFVPDAGSTNEGIPSLPRNLSVCNLILGH